MLQTETQVKNGQTEVPAAAAETNRDAVAAVLDLIRARNIRFVDMWFTELRGRSWRISIRADMVNEKFFSSVVTLDGKTVGGSWEGFILLRPDPAAVFVDPIAEVPSLALICDVVSAEEGENYPMDPRRVLKRAESYLRQSGIASDCVVGAEPEFFLLDGDKPVPEDALREFLRTMAATLGEAGMQIDWFRIGPAAGQGRVQMRAMPALRTADQVVIYKHVAKRLARRHGWTPVFLPKPLADGGAAGMPQHHALWRAGTNLFHDDAGWALTSPAGLAYAAGILRHAPALLAFCAPTTNSYRRLIPGTQAPTELILSKHRITALCRVPAGSTGPNPAARRVKFCGSDSSANPYFALASTLMAGLDGIEQALTPPLEHAEESFPRRLPHSLEETLTELERDNAFLLKGGVFTAETLRAWIDEVWKLQVLPVRSRPHPWELRLEEDR